MSTRRHVAAHLLKYKAPTALHILSDAADKSHQRQNALSTWVGNSHSILGLESHGVPGHAGQVPADMGLHEDLDRLTPDTDLVGYVSSKLTPGGASARATAQAHRMHGSRAVSCSLAAAGCSNGIDCSEFCCVGLLFEWLLGVYAGRRMDVWGMLCRYQEQPIR